MAADASCCLAAAAIALRIPSRKPGGVGDGGDQCAPFLVDQHGPGLPGDVEDFLDRRGDRRLRAGRGLRRAGQQKIALAQHRGLGTCTRRIARPRSITASFTSLWANLEASRSASVTMAWFC
ncbi:hypothetical protein [Azospirillum sp. INR13]|uniref:hypothetical protein n=1 Tax=Azospirillum sp. INR13 TaxID=2596919 RepID=UPI0021041AC5|nr:hypothetical protein [Azospirillum sp. INR13]